MLSAAEVDVEAGSEAVLTVRVRNSGSVVDQFSFEVAGDAAPWATFEPPVLSLFPAAEGTTEVRFKPPRSPSTPAGAVPFAIRVISQEDPAGGVAEEGVLRVAPFTDLFAELVPRTGSGRRSGRFQLALDNRGNTHIRARVEATDPDDQLTFVATPSTLVAAPGTAAFSRVEAKPRNTFLRGPSVTRPFQVVVMPEDEAELVVADGTLLHEAVIPRWLPRVAAGLVGTLVGLAVLWLAFLKPSVKSTAREAAVEAIAAPLAQTSKDIAGLAEKIGVEPPPPVTVGPPPTTTTTAPPTTTAVPPPPAPGAGDPVDGRLEVTGSNQTVDFTVPAGRVMSLTDLVLQNPAGDSGELRVQRGNTTLLVLRLDNFRDLDYHFVTPVAFGPGQVLRLRVTCANQAAPPATNRPPCSPAIYYNGFTRDA